MKIHDVVWLVKWFTLHGNVCHVRALDLSLNIHYARILASGRWPFCNPANTISQCSGHVAMDDHCRSVGGCPRVVVSTAAFHARARFGSRSRRSERNKNVSSLSTCESHYCEEPPWPRGSVHGLRPPGILCLVDSGISIISPSSLPFGHGNNSVFLPVGSKTTSLKPECQIKSVDEPASSDFAGRQL